MFRIATLLDRRPSNYFKKWVEYHTQIFDKNKFIFVDFSKDIEELKQYLTNQGFEKVVVLTITKNKVTDTSKFDEELNMLLEHMVEINAPIIFHCCYKNIIEQTPYSDTYKSLISETPYIVNRIKSQWINKKKFKFIFLDSDELLVGKNINELLNSDFEYIVPEGYEIIQSAYENKMHWHIPIYIQRSYWKRNSFFYDKPIIVQKDIQWGPGRHLHLHKENIIQPSEDIKLIHLRDVCFDYLYEENNYSKILYPLGVEDHRKNWEDYDVFKGWAIERQLGIESIPEDIKDLFKKYNV